MSLFKGLDTPFFGSATGEPLAFGFVYFGQPNQDAIANPKVPYANRGLSIPLPATQELTIAGKFQQEIWLDGDYSMIITDANGVQQAEYLIVPESEGGSGGVQSVVAGANITVDNTDPANPIVSSTGSDRRTVTYIEPISGVVTLDHSLGDYFVLDLTENVTNWVVVNAPMTTIGGNMMVRIRQPASPKTNTFPDSFLFTEGSSDEVPSGGNAVALLALTSFGDGRWDATMVNVPQPPDPDEVPGIPSNAIRIDDEALWSVSNWSSGFGWTIDPYDGPYPNDGWGISSAPNAGGAAFSLFPVGGWNTAFRPSKIYVFRSFATSDPIFANRVQVYLNNGTVFSTSSTDSSGAITVDMPGTDSYVVQIRFTGINVGSGQSTGLHASVIAYE